MYGFCRMSQCVGRMGRQVADDTCEFLSRVCCFFIFLCASRVDAVCIHSQLDGLAAFQRRDHLTWVKCPTWPNQWSNQLTQKSGYRAISLAPIFVWIVLRNFKSFLCLKVNFFFFLGGVHLHTVDGSEIRLTSWYGNHPIICRVFIHSRWLFGMSCINNYESPPYWDTPTFDRCCRCIACRRRRSFLLLQNLRTPRYQDQYVFCWKCSPEKEPQILKHL